MAHIGEELGFGAVGGFRGFLRGDQPLLVAPHLLQGAARAQDVANAVIEDEPIQRLRDEIGRAGIVSAGDRRHVIEARRDNDRHVGGFGTAAQNAAQLIAVHMRHHQVDQQQIGVVLLIEPTPFHPVAGLDDHEAIVLQRRAHQRTHDGIVIHHEDRRAGSQLGVMHRQLQRPRGAMIGWSRREPNGRDADGGLLSELMNLALRGDATGG